MEKEKSKFSVSQIVSFLKENKIPYRMDGVTEDIQIGSFCPLNNLKEDSITWIRHASDFPSKEVNHIKNILILAELEEEITNSDAPIIYVKNVHRTYFRIIEYFFGEKDFENKEPLVEPTATVLTNTLGKNVYIGHGTFIDKDVKIGNNVKIYHNVTIQGRCTIGNDTVIESGVVIGVCGFGHYRDEENNPVCVPHMVSSVELYGVATV